MQASKETINTDDILICTIDVHGDGRYHNYDCRVIRIDGNGVDTLYLEGYHSRNDYVSWDKIRAKLNDSKDCVEAGEFNGRFQLFDSYVEVGYER